MYKRLMFIAIILFPKKSSTKHTFVKQPHLNLTETLVVHNNNFIVILLRETFREQQVQNRPELLHRRLNISYLHLLEAIIGYSFNKQMKELLESCKKNCSKPKTR